MSFTRGAGGFSISPRLSFVNVVPWDSPAFALLEAYKMDWDGVLKNPSKHAEKILMQMYRLFETGKASSTDVNQYGNTLLHVSIL